MKHIVLMFFVSFCIVAKGQTIEPMVGASWHQSSPFNNDCPEGAAAGCGATAVAQILNYYKMPSHGYGEYNHNGVNYKLEDYPIGWDNILNTYTKGNYTEANSAAVAWLVYLTGLSMDMKYGKTSSPRTYASMLWGMQHYLHISPDSRYLHRHNYSTSEWKAMIDKQLEAGHPVFYRGTYIDSDNKGIGHMFVIDGKNSEGLYHVNFGHADSSQDKYVDLDYINQSSGDDVYPGNKSVCYNATQAMVINCYPVSGLSENDYELHPVILDSPIIVNKDTLCNVFETQLGQGFSISYRVCDCSFDGGKSYIGIGAFQDNEIKIILPESTSQVTLGGGFVYDMGKNYSIPEGTASGTYELAVIYHEKGNRNWKRCWDNAQNSMKLTVNGNTATVYPTNNFLNGELKYRSKLKEVAGNGDGHTFEIELSNVSNANYEDTLMLRFNIEGKIYEHKHIVAVYEGCKPTYRILVPESSVSLNGKTYTVEALYYNKLKKGYCALDYDNGTSIENINATTNDNVLIYSLDGKCLWEGKAEQISKVRQTLDRGVYIIKQGGHTEKIAIMK